MTNYATLKSKGVSGHILVADWVAHYLNPLHIYCRLLELHMGKRPSRFVVRYYEFLYRLVWR